MTREKLLIFLKSILSAMDIVSGRHTVQKEGLQILQEHDIQLAILDIMMPKMDGISVFAGITERRKCGAGSVTDS